MYHFRKVPVLRFLKNRFNFDLVIKLHLKLQK